MHMWRTSSLFWCRYDLQLDVTTLRAITESERISEGSEHTSEAQAQAQGQQGQQGQPGGGGGGVGDDKAQQADGQEGGAEGQEQQDVQQNQIAGGYAARPAPPAPPNHLPARGDVGGGVVGGKGGAEAEL